jgi:hypothetical protein
MQCILYKIYFWKVFHMYYNLICILYALLCGQNFILVKSGCYRSQARKIVYVSNSMPTWSTKKDCVRQGLAIHIQILEETSRINGY